MSDRYFAFVSYAKEHGEWVAKLQQDLERCLDHYARTVDPSIAQKVFLDQVDLQSGRTWIDQFQEAVDQSDRLILVVSPEALASKWVRIEWQSFFAKRPEDVFPVRIAEAELATFLDPIQSIDFMGLEGGAYNQRLRQFFGDLLRRSRRDPPPMPPELAPPDAPESTYTSDATRDLSRQLEGAYEQRAEILAAGGDATRVNETIVGLKRKLREGPQLEAGDFLLDGRFKLLETLGRGGFATVWKAYDRERQSLAAVKVLHSQYSKDQSRRDRFFRGARQMASLRHPGIVSVVETECEDGGYHFFAMEYLPGGDFRQAVLEGRLSREERLRVVLAIGEALSYAHGRGVIHRDVKPANILLDLEGRAKLTDFDLVRAADTTGGTRTAMMGTIVYAAPEAMLDGKQAAEPADVYGLGMTALFALHASDLAVDVLYEPKTLIDSLPLSASGRRVLRRALAREAERRWESIEEFCSAFEAAELSAVIQPKPEPAAARRVPIRRVSGSGSLSSASAHRSPAERPGSGRLRSFLSWTGLLLVGSILSILLADFLEGPRSPWRTVESHSEQPDTTANSEQAPPPPSPPPPVQRGESEEESSSTSVGAQDSETGLTSPPSRNPDLPAHCQEAQRKTGIEFVFVSGGTYTLGADDIGESWSEPVHRVELSSFWIGKHPVTNDQYWRFLSATAYGEPLYWADERFDDPLQPVVGVSWLDATSFSEWAGVSLPSEAQWEAAARGPKGFKYPWGDTPPTAELSDSGKNYQTDRPDRVGSHPEGAGPFGAEDQAGGVWEWCLDVWDAEAYADRDGKRDPLTIVPEGADKSASDRVLRGTSWAFETEYLPSAIRIGLGAGNLDRDIGFRVLCGSVPEP